MPRKRKIPIANEEKENENDAPQLNNILANNPTLSNGPIYTIMSKVQLNETYHKKYIKELKQLYEKVNNILPMPHEIIHILFLIFLLFADGS